MGQHLAGSGRAPSQPLTPAHHWGLEARPTRPWPDHRNRRDHTSTGQPDL